MDNYSKSSYQRISIGLGRSNGLVASAIRGFNPAAGTSFETVWGEGGIYSFPESASVMTVSSDSINDTSGGTGGTSVLIEYLDENYIKNFEVVVLNGTTPVNTVASMLRINAAVTNTVGSNKTNIGNIYIGTGTVTAGKPTNVYEIILTGHGLAKTAVYTIPDGKINANLVFTFSSEGNKLTTYKLNVINVFGGGEILESFRLEGSTGTTTMESYAGQVLPRTDLRFDTKVSTGVGEVSILTESVEGRYEA